MKIYSKIIAVAVAAASLATLAGCNKKQPNNRVATTANWNTRISATVEKDSFDYWKSHKEVATYSTDFTEGANGTYKMAYDTAAATCGTAFYMTEYNWQSANIPEDFRTQEEKKEPVYVYEYSLKINGSCSAKQSPDVAVQLSDELTSVCYYRTCGDNLQPVYSKQIVKNTAPKLLNTNSAELALVTTDATFECFYDYTCTKAKTVKVDNTETDESKKRTESVVEFNNKKNYSVFDNSQLRGALRALTMTSGATRNFNVVSPQDNAVTMCKAAISGAVELKKDLTEEGNTLLNQQVQITNALNECKSSGYIFFDGTPSGDDPDALALNYRYNQVTLSIDQELTGPTTTLWYSTVENADMNGTRSVLLREARNLSFGLGMLTYSLKTLSIQKI